MEQKKIEKYKKFNINGMNSFNELIFDMAKTEERKIHVENGNRGINEYAEYAELKESPVFWETDHKAIFNLKSGRTAQIATDNYKILQHRDFFSMISDLFTNSGNTDIIGHVLEIDQGNSYVARLIFDSIEIEEPNMGRNIKVGIEVGNSSNGVKSAYLKAFYLRISCTNQMTSKHIIPECEASRSHNAISANKMLESITIKSENFLKQLVISGAKFTNVMNKAIDDELVFENPVQLATATENIFTTKKHSENISNMAMKKAKKLGDKYYLNRWDFYNTVTDYTSHQPMTPNVFDSILEKAESKILIKPVEIPEMIMIKQ